jgi:F-type H+-transporting ATPase subunit b
MSMLKRLTLLMIVCVGLLLAGPISQSRAAEEGHNTAATGAAGHAEEHHDLLPDPHSAQTWYSALWVVIIFCVLLAVLYKYAWKNVLVGLKAREERIRKDIADAEAARAKSEGLLKEYNAQLATAEAKVREMLSNATAEGERISTQIKMQAQQDAEATKERAVKDIEAARHQALQQIYAEAATLSTSIAEKILRRNLNADDQRDLVNQSLEQLQTVGQN